jgi:hypothetical protein
VSGTKLKTMSKSTANCSERQTLEEYMKKLVVLGVINDSELKEHGEEGQKSV